MEFPKPPNCISSEASFSENNRPTYSDQLRLNNNQEQMYSFEELFQIFTTSASELARCTTKLEQIQVIMSLLKYAR